MRDTDKILMDLVMDGVQYAADWEAMVRKADEIRKSGEIAGKMLEDALKLWEHHGDRAKNFFMLYVLEEDVEKKQMLKEHYTRERQTREAYKVLLLNCLEG